MTARPLHVDTDPGLDDLLALALALASPELELQSVTTVAGNASLDAVSENAARFLRLAGSDAALARGAAGPLALSTVDATHVHGADGRGGVDLPGPGRPFDDGDLLGAALRAGHALVALGPLTNLGRLATDEPALLRDAPIVWMGGTLGRGNATPFAEFNCWADPRALAALLEAGPALRVVGLEVTHQVVLQPDELPAGALGGSPLGRFLEATVAALCRDGGGVLHDPCAVVAAFAPELFDWEDVGLDVVVDGGPKRGKLARAGGERTVRYACGVRAEEVKRRFLERLVRWAGAVSEPPRR